MHLKTTSGVDEEHYSHSGQSHTKSTVTAAKEGRFSTVSSVSEGRPSTLSSTGEGQYMEGVSEASPQNVQGPSRQDTQGLIEEADKPPAYDDVAGCSDQFHSEQSVVYQSTSDKQAITSQVIIQYLSLMLIYPG